MEISLKLKPSAIAQHRVYTQSATNKVMTGVKVKSSRCGLLIIDFQRVVWNLKQRHTHPT